MRRAARAHGFTLIEMVVTMVIFALLTALAVPTMSAWLRNNKVRAVADAIQNGVRIAQSEAVRRSRQVVLSLTNSTTQAGLTATANGRFWSINTVPAVAGEANVFVQSGILADSSGAVTITGPAAICFNSIGRQVANAATGVAGATCTLPVASPPVTPYDVAVAGAAKSGDRPLRVTVSLGGQVHLCDPSKALSAANPDGC